MPFPLETERLLLRRFCDEDLEAFFAYRNDFPVAQYQGWEFPYPREQAVAFIEEMKAKEPVAPGQWFQAAIELKASHEVIGDVAFQIMQDDPRQAYIGYTLARAHWWKGYGAESVRRLVDYLFGELKLHRVVARCDVENVSSYHLLERMKFRREAHFVDAVWFKGKYVSEYWYAMLRREWEQR